jgi:hypothetical protein
MEIEADDVEEAKDVAMCELVDNSLEIKWDRDDMKLGNMYVDDVEAT